VLEYSKQKRSKGVKGNDYHLRGATTVGKEKGKSQRLRKTKSENPIGAAHLRQEYPQLFGKEGKQHNENSSTKVNP